MRAVDAAQILNRQMVNEVSAPVVAEDAMARMGTMVALDCEPAQFHVPRARQVKTIDLRAGIQFNDGLVQARPLDFHARLGVQRAADQKRACRQRDRVPGARALDGFLDRPRVIRLIVGPRAKVGNIPDHRQTLKLSQRKAKSRQPSRPPECQARQRARHCAPEKSARQMTPFRKGWPKSPASGGRVPG